MRSPEQPMTDRNWQPIETAPKDVLVLMFERQPEFLSSVDALVGIVFAGWWDGEGWRNNLDQQEQAPTHWMPLPEPPVSP